VSKGHVRAVANEEVDKDSVRITDSERRAQQASGEAVGISDAQVRGSTIRGPTGPCIRMQELSEQVADKANKEVLMK